MREVRALALAGAVAVLAFPAGAAADVGVSLTAVGQPSYFKLSSRPGRAVRAQIRLANLTGAPRSVRLAAIDVGVAQAGGLAYGLGAARGDGRWLRLARRSVTLAPHAMTTVAFRAVVPRRTAPGDHYAAIAATVSTARARRRAGAVGVRFVTRLAIAVRVRLPGPRRARLRLGAVAIARAGVPALVVPMVNRGTALLERAELSLAVTRAGQRVLRVHEPLGAFVPRGALRLALRWPGRPAAGHYLVTGWVRAGGRRLPIRASLRVRP